MGDGAHPYGNVTCFTGFELSGKRGALLKETPIQQPTEFELGVNLQTCRTLGLTIPPSTLSRADEVIE